jgi:hypothetical protein
MSDLETFLRRESVSSFNEKSTRLAEAYRSKTLLTMREVIEINIYGFIESASVYDTVKERRLRMEVQQRVNKLRDALIQKGVPGERVWLGGIAFSTNRPGQIDSFLKERKPPLFQAYPHLVVDPMPYIPSEKNEKWLDAEGMVKVNVLKKEIAAEVSLSFKDGDGVRQVLKPISIKFGIKPDGSLGEASAEIKLFEHEFERRRFGPFTDFKLEITGIGSVEFEGNAAEGIKKELNAKLKAAVGASLFVPRTKVKIPVEASIGIDIKGKPLPAIEFTVFRW